MQNKLITEPIAESDGPKKSKPSMRERADSIKNYRCKNLIAVLEEPRDIKNIGTVIRNVNALGVEKVYVVDPKRALPDDWQEMRERKSLSKTSASAVKWSFVKRFDSTDECFSHLEKNGFEFEGVKRRSVTKGDRILDQHIFALLRET